jgi:putative flippase GtrA
MMRPIRNIVEQVLDFFYPIFQRFLPQQTFRYIACGGFATMVDLCLFYVLQNFVFADRPVRFLGMDFESYTASFVLAFCISFPLGFFLSRYVVFQESSLKGRQSLVRYMMIVAINICLNYILLKGQVKYLHIYPTVAKLITTVVVVLFSYVMQKRFAFK